MAFAGAFSTYDATETALNHGTIFRIRSVDQQVHWRNTASSEFYKFLTNLPQGAPAIQVRHEWGETDKARNYVVVKADAASGATSIDVDDAYLCVADDALYNERTGEIVRIDAVDDADTISTAATTGYGRGFMGSTAAAMRIGDRLIKLGTLLAEEGTAADSTGVMPVDRWNYLEAWQKTWTVTKMQQDSVMLDGVGQIDEQYMRKLWEFSEEINAALWFSRRNRVVTAAGNLYTLNGFDQQVKTHVLDFSNIAVPNWTILNEMFSQLFQASASSMEKGFFCGQGAYTSFLNAARALNVGIETWDTLYGTRIQAVQVDGGTIHLIPDYRTFKGALSGSGRVVDMANIEFKQYMGWGRLVKQNVQPNDQPTIRKDMVMEAGTLEVRHEATHARVDGLSQAFNTVRSW